MSTKTHPRPQTETLRVVIADQVRKSYTKIERERTKKARLDAAWEASWGHPLPVFAHASDPTAGVRRAVVSFDVVCRYCLQAPATTVDHVLPRSRGGTSRFLNLVGCCPACNSAKGNRTPVEAGMKLHLPSRFFLPGCAPDGDPQKWDRPIRPAEDTPEQQALYQGLHARRKNRLQTMMGRGTAPRTRHTNTQPDAERHELEKRVCSLDEAWELASSEPLPVFARADHRIQPVQRAAVLAADMMCTFCQKARAVRVVHLIPTTMGGTSRWSNLAGACEPCVSRKAQRTPRQAGMTWRPSLRVFEERAHPAGLDPRIEPTQRLRRGRPSDFGLVPAARRRRVSRTAPRGAGRTILPAVSRGDRVRFHDDPDAWWTVQAASARFVVLTRPNLDMPWKEDLYTVVDFKAGFRGPVNTPTLRWAMNPALIHQGASDMLLFLRVGSGEVKRRAITPEIRTRNPLAEKGLRVTEKATHQRPLFVDGLIFGGPQ